MKALPMWEFCFHGDERPIIITSASEKMEGAKILAMYKYKKNWNKKGKESDLYSIYSKGEVLVDG